jgi:hypothetical protein
VNRPAGERHILKSDCYIIATAIIHGADSIVTGNVKEYRRLAGARIKIMDVPDSPVQPQFDFQSKEV